VMEIALAPTVGEAMTVLLLIAIYILVRMEGSVMDRINATVPFQMVLLGQPVPILAALEILANMVLLA